MDNKKVIPISLGMSWQDMLGADNSEFTAEERLTRWQQWMELAKKNNETELIEELTNASACHYCKQLDKENAWCKDMGLPVAVNPVLTIKHGVPGMACMGSYHGQ